MELKIYPRTLLSGNFALNKPDGGLELGWE